MTPTTLANHLWQSTLFAALAWLVSRALWKNQAAVRYWIWLAASVKFLFPFSLLTSAGKQLAWRGGPAIAQPQFVTAMTDVGQPFAISAQGPPSTATPEAFSALFIILAGVWLCGVILGLVFWIRAVRQIRAIRHAAIPLHLGLPIPVMSSSSRMEPSVFGIRNPVLVLPAGITGRLTPAQLETVLAHELCHIRRMDNLTASIHMVVEIIFWFYPLLWWIRTQLVAERERACDEDVIRMSNDPQVYAEGILNVCKLYIESPLTCVSGITSADLRKRIETIMTCRAAQNLDLRRKFLLAAVGIAAVTAPVAIGLFNAPASKAQTPSATLQPISYVASIKPNNDVPPHTFSEYSTGGRLTATAVTVAALLRIAYRIQPYQLVGAPAWISTKRYDISAKAEDSHTPSQQALLQALLKDRFKLAVHNETRELPIFALVLARGDGRLGPQLSKSTFDCTAYFAGAHDAPTAGKTPNCATRIGLGALSGKAIPMTQLATSLSPLVGRFTVDRTGLAGGFDVELTWAPDQVSPNMADNTLSGAAPNSSGPSIFAALQEELGLKLTSEKGPVAVLAVDRLEEPSAN